MLHQAAPRGKMAHPSGLDRRPSRLPSVRSNEVISDESSSGTCHLSICHAHCFMYIMVQHLHAWAACEGQ